ncbi:A/G-specific adenine glycosylase [Parabacteroides sp. Marseille-P3160]|uniref:A/G-specific adenine glycosylase n=1 Tax=Parabacteroides sp. Marseille-P3160 TaxID=1917887 RepID=UPI0009BAC792|nr:A/G-specific adenine glycosylase [Parabacteroides sp. Marseille-P3160]
MTQAKDKYKISEIFINWYRQHQRELPWRETKDPYLIWISEIILQQTRVAQGLEYYRRFTERFPTVKSLAEAREEEVLKYWQGLGYYSRARNLHTAAREVMVRFGGHFPCRYEDILSLRGIGEYTAAAIVSFAWNEPYPVVDGNVYRVLSRLFAIDTPIDSSKGKKQFTELAQMLLNPEKAGIQNQAVMEFGALQCIPQNPDCPHCVFEDYCMAFHAGKVQSLPFKQHKTKTRNRYFNYLYLIYKGQTYLHRRSGKDIWEGLYEFPLIETESSVDFAALSRMEAFARLLPPEIPLTLLSSKTGVKHVLSHQILYASFYKIELASPLRPDNAYRPIPPEELEHYAIPRLIHSYLENDY